MFQLGQLTINKQPTGSEAQLDGTTLPGVGKSREKSLTVQQDYLREVRCQGECPGYSVQWGFFYLGGGIVWVGTLSRDAPQKCFDAMTTTCSDHDLCHRR